ncbi:hypothetical protein LINPERHAP2_LOCUS4007 [Linum perenne]
MASSRRSVSVSSFDSATGRMLKISEACSNGKLFYVLILESSAAEGWKSLLLLRQNWIATALAPPPPNSWAAKSSTSKAHASFASVVRGPSLSFQGRCVASPKKGQVGIKVESDGVHDRRSFLECCVVFRFCSHSSIDWIRFRKWANKNWDSALDAPVHELDDGLWMMFCGSSSKVDRILAINRRSFNSIPILLDRWIPDAGCSSVLSSENVFWVTFSGITIHLRSPDLFRQLGEVCGVFLGFEACSSLSSVRIKIKCGGELPKVIPISFENATFEVKVFPDESPRSVGKGKAVLRPISSLGFGYPGCFEFGSTSSSSPVSKVPSRSSPPVTWGSSSKEMSICHSSTLGILREGSGPSEILTAVRLPKATSDCDWITETVCGWLVRPVEMERLPFSYWILVWAPLGQALAPLGALLKV